MVDDEVNRELMNVRDDAGDPQSQSLAPLGLDEVCSEV
jgi:hypothetical protein